jgi:hypothetical protein
MSRCSFLMKMCSLLAADVGEEAVAGGSRRLSRWFRCCRTYVSVRDGAVGD